ncbi:MAG: D-alanyl-D-alanine carboxypeptidase [Ruminococcaceae bacterium]|nr:D-alanyl-D-alanine carboxypeptidase [Oscillospiraceae bacterium]
MIIKRIVALLLTLCSVFCLFASQISAEPGATDNSAPNFNFDCRSAILMEAGTGRVLYEMNADEALSPASVTKVMTLLLVMEAIEAGKISYSDMVTASAHACSMGGSQIYLEEGEQMSVEDMIKSVVIASANDAALALAEHVAGTEEAFVKMMNEKAAALGLSATHFENTNGLDDSVQNHVTSARDIAIMSRELIKHKKITEYSSIWMDTIRNGEFGLTNTNRLVRFYKGATGLKTGSTAKAKFCITATAERDGMSLICVIMAAPTRDIRNAAASSLLDWGFANYGVYKAEAKALDPVRVIGGVRQSCSVAYPEFSCVVNKSDIPKISCEIELPESVPAPIKSGEKIGRVVYKLGDKEIGAADILASESVEKIDFWGLLLKMLSKMAIA